MSNSQWAIHGHEMSVELLQKAISSQAGPRHAYLFLGPRHVGKSTVAQTFAKALLCSATANNTIDNTMPQSNPCGVCRSCKLIASGNHPDFQLIQPLNKDGNPDRENGLLRVEQASQIIQDASLSPLNSRYKIFVIQEMHSAHPSFANKLLKTLEEPPAYVILCLTAPDRASVLPTIASRCQILELRALPASTIETVLCNEWNVDAAQASLIARISNGRLGWALEQLADKKSLEKRAADLETLQKLTKAGRVERLAFAAELATKRNNKQLFGLLELWMLWWRDVMLAQSGCVDSCCNVDKRAEILHYAQAIPQHIVQQYIHTLRRIESYLRHTTSLRMALDVVLLQLPRIAADPE